MAKIPADLQYTKEHEWLRESDGVLRVGITAFAVEQLGDVTMVELPEVGDTLDKEQVLGTVESVKAVSDIYAPIAGTVTAINKALEDAPEAVNDAPYDGGWLVEIKASEADPCAGLMDAKAYTAFCCAAED